MQSINRQYLFCPITKQIFLNPVIASDGIHYESEAINLWLEKATISPLTRQPINKLMYNSIFMKNLVKDFLLENPSEQSNQYVKSYCHLDNIAEVSNIIKNKEFNKLLLYREFHLEYLFDNIVQLIQNNDKIFFHIIDNTVNLEVKDNEKWSLVYFICMYGTLESIEYIISKGVTLSSDLFDNININAKLSSDDKINFEFLKHIN